MENKKKTFLDDFRNRKDEDNMIKQHSVNLHEKFYNLVKIHCVLNNVPIITFMDSLVEKAVESGEIEKFSLDNKTIKSDKNK